MKNLVAIVQIILSIVLSALIFLQSKGDSESRSNILSNVNFEKRGWEKVVFYLTLFTIGLFLISSIVQALI